MTTYYFALDGLLEDLKINPTQAYKRYFEPLPKHKRLSRGGLYIMCRRPKFVEVETVNKLCNAMGIKPADLWREERASGERK